MVVYSQVAAAERMRTALPTQRVVVAATDIPPRSEIAAAMLTVQAVPDPLMQDSAATKVEDVAG